MEKKFISLVVYLHDAAPYLKYFLDTVLPVFEKNFQQYEVVCVDDASVDGTTQVLRGVCGVKAGESHGECCAHELFPGS